MKCSHSAHWFLWTGIGLTVAAVPITILTAILGAGASLGQSGTALVLAMITGLLAAGGAVTGTTLISMGAFMKAKGTGRDRTEPEAAESREK